ncbi:hypothetical protein H6G91_29500 [Nostoc muscorum FACHB-395]|nr:hypothetical protein [Desmonostoc muscorum FACHB-395]
MTDFNKGDRVVIVDGDFKGQSGTVIDNPTRFTDFQTQSEVKLDKGNSVKVPDRHLNHESSVLNVDAEITNLSNQIERVASQLPGKIREELGTHFGYLRESLRSKDESRFYQQSSYISSELIIGVQNGSIKEESKENIINSLKKLENWLVK